VYPARNSFQETVMIFKKPHKKAALAAELILALPGTSSENAGYRPRNRFCGIGCVPALTAKGRYRG
jgi:hypothetical protein